MDKLCSEALLDVDLCTVFSREPVSQCSQQAEPLSSPQISACLLALNPGGSESVRLCFKLR